MDSSGQPALRVLCVEDNEHDVLLLSRALARFVSEAKMVQAASLREARELLAQERFDIILLDLSLPDVKGLQTVKRMREIAGGIPIVVLTGSTDDALGKHCVQAGAQDYLVKDTIDTALLNRVMTHAIERQRIEQELLAHREHLQELVGERTVELAEARDAALESARLKAEFTSNMSHEIRTPLNAVIGMMELLMTTHLTAAQKQYAKVAQSAGEALLRIINDILDFSKMESGHMVLETRNLHLADVIKTVVGLISHPAAVKGVALIVDLQPTIPDPLRGDVGRLQQVLLNLIGNAVKFTEKGSVSIQARMLNETPDHAVLEFRIADTGIGLSQKAKRQLFQPFFQADHSVTRKFGGTGLGLAISKKLVELMGGKMGLESVWGRGSTFWFSVPFMKATSKQRTDGSSVSSTVRRPVVHAAASDRKRTRILVADDNEFNRILAEEQLVKLGYDVETVSDGAQALSALTKGDFPLVLMDCRMPYLDGYQATLEWRKRETDGGSRTVVIAMTANVLQADYQRAISAGMDDYLTKPVNIENLKKVLDRWLTKPGKPPMPIEASETPAISALAEAVDLQILRGATQGDLAALERLKGSFFKQSDDLLRQLERAIAAGSVTEVERLAHCLAGSSHCFGAVSMVSALRQIEQAAMNGQLGITKALLSQTRDNYDSVKAFIAKEYGG